MVAKISISIPQDLLDRIEKERETTGQSRSQFFALVTEAFLKKKREQELDEQYRRGYEMYPETEEEVAAVEAVTAQALKFMYEEEREAAE